MKYLTKALLEMAQGALKEWQITAKDVIVSENRDSFSVAAPMLKNTAICCFEKENVSCPL